MLDANININPKIQIGNKRRAFGAEAQDRSSINFIGSSLRNVDLRTYGDAVINSIDSVHINDSDKD